MKKAYHLFILTFMSYIWTIIPASADLTDGLLLYFPFDEGKGEMVKDHSGNGHDGEIFEFDQVDWDEGKFGGAIVMSGKGAEKEANFDRKGRIEVRDDLGSHKALSISVWFNDTIDGAGWNYFADFRPTGSWFARDGSQTIKFNDEGSGVPSGDYPRKEWVHLVVLANAKTTTFYINGKRTGIPGTGANLNISTNLHVGSRFSKNESFLTHLDEWAMWDRLLTKTEISQLLEQPVIPLSVESSGKAAITWSRIKTQ